MQIKQIDDIITSVKKVKGIYVALPVSIAAYIMYPLLKGDYLYPFAEYELWKSFVFNFLEILKGGELPVWNEYVGCGHPALYFGHYPMSQNTIFYMLFGFNDFTFYFTKFLSLIILLFSTIYAFRSIGFGYLFSLIGALIYFSVNFVIRVMVAETIGNLLFVYPLLMILMIKVAAESRKRDVLIFSLVYIFWLSGGHIIYVYMHLAMLSLVYWVAVFVFHEFKAVGLKNLGKFVTLYFILFIIPILGVAYQYYLIYDVIAASNRFKEGLIISPFEPIVWKQLLVSFQSSSYFWFGFFAFLIYAVIQILPSNYSLAAGKRFQVPAGFLYPVLAALLVLTVTGVQSSSTSNLVVDYLPIVNDRVFRIALLLYFAIHLVSNRTRPVFFVSISDSFIFLIYVSLLSHYFYSPENIIGDVKGYDYDLFRELSVLFQVLFTLLVLFSVADYGKNKVVKITVLSLIVLYLLRSHFTIPLLRFTGIVWYAPRDGSIFSVFFAILFIYGLRNVLSSLPQAFKGGREQLREQFKYSFLILLVALLTVDSFNKFYKGTSHRFIYPNKEELAKTPMEQWVIEGRREATALKNKLLELDKETKHFHRLFTPENSYLYLGGSMQDHKLYEAVIYESSISRELQDLYNDTILVKQSSKELKDVMPYFLFTRHVHAGLGLEYREIAYRDFFIFSPAKDIEYLKNQNIEFLWDIMQVKYLIIGPEFSQVLKGFSDNAQYRLVCEYPKLHLDLYEIVKNKSYARLAILPLDSAQNYEKMLEQINSKDVNVLRDLHSKLIFLGQDNADFALLEEQRSNTARRYEIFSRQDAILVDFESWNHNWKLRVNNKGEELHKAFQMFKGIRLGPGVNHIELTYKLRYFKELFILSNFVILTYLILLGREFIAQNTRGTL